MYNLYVDDKEDNAVIRGEGIQFDRVRRITGYLTGSLNTWGNGKLAELNDRVSHEKMVEIIK